MRIIYVLVVFFITSASVLSIDMKLNYERLDVDFRGVVNSEHSIVCYGTGSIILKSYDNGDTWQQECIHHDSLDITDMIYKDDYFYALLTRGYIVIGDNYSNNWKSINTEIPYQQSIEVKDNEIFILGLNSIYIFEDNNIKQEISLIDTNQFTELRIFNDKLLVSGKNGKLISIDLSDNYSQELIDFQDLGLCSTCGSLSRMKTENNKFYVSHKWDVIESTDLVNWQKIAKDMPLYEVKEGSVFNLRASSTMYLNAALLELSVAGQDSNIKISKDWQQRNVDILAFIDYKFCNDSIVVAVGRDKLIAVSKDSGVNWELKSNYTGYGFEVVTDSLFYSIRSRGRIYKTSNAGVTWLPPLFTDTLVRSFNVADYIEFNSNGYGLVFANSSIRFEPNLLFTKDYGNTYELRLSERLNGLIGTGNFSFIKTQSGYNLIKPRVVQVEPLTSIITVDTAFNFISRINYDSIYINGIFEVDEKQTLGIALDMKWPYYSKGNVSDSNHYIFLYSYDRGKTWEKTFDLFMADTILRSTINLFDKKILIGGVHWYKEPKDTANINQLYLIDMNSQKRTRIFNDVVSSYGNITKYNDYLMFGGWEYLFVNQNFIKDQYNWEKIPYQGKYIMSIVYKYDKLWFGMYDIPSRQTHQYKVNFDLITDTEETVEVKSYLYSFPAYPNPAKNFVSCDIYWDLRHDIEKSDIGIYDYKGVRVADRNDFTIDFRNSSSGILTWDCSKYDSGVYFIIIKHGDATRTIPVVVNR